MNGRVHKTMATLLLACVSGCASGPFHRKTVPPPALQPQPPELSQTPLYSPEMSDGPTKLPNLPATQTQAVVKPPDPPPPKPHKTHKPKPPTTTAKATAPAKGDANGGTAAPATPGSAVPATTAGTTPAAPSAGDAQTTSPEKKADTQQAATGEAPATSPIGELTAGGPAEAAQTSRQAEDLIKATKNGVDGIKRELSADEKKTVVEIGTFLNRAEQALKNGDVDGAYGLATKAKILLDELTQK